VPAPWRGEDSHRKRRTKYTLWAVTRRLTVFGTARQVQSNLSPASYNLTTHLQTCKSSVRATVTCWLGACRRRRPCWCDRRDSEPDRAFPPSAHQCRVHQHGSGAAPGNQSTARGGLAI